MNKNDIIEEIQAISRLYDIGRANMVIDKLEAGLSKALELRKVIENLDDGLKAEFDKMHPNGFYHLEHGLHSQIYNFMNLLEKSDGMLPSLEKAITYLKNPKNPDMWRRLGMLYLAQKNDLEKACEAWKKALELNPTFLERFPGLNVVHVFEAMKKQGKKISWKVEKLDMKTGNFSVVITKE